MVFWYLIAILDQYSRKIVGWGFFPQVTQAEVKRVWDRALLSEGLLNGEGKRMPQAVSDRGSQMKAKSIKAFFKDLGIAQLFCRPRTPDDNAEMESFFATLKCERLYRGDYGQGDALQAEADIAAFIDYYNQGRAYTRGLASSRPRRGMRAETRRYKRRGSEGLNWPAWCGSLRMVAVPLAGCRAAKRTARGSRLVNEALRGWAE